MGKCIHHPDRETSYICMKHQIYLCEDCLECRDPKIYCKHRSACPIWFNGKHKEGWEAEDRKAAPHHPQGHVSARRTDDSPARRQHYAESAARGIGAHTNAFSNGKGSCGKCKLLVVGGEVKTRPIPLLTDSEKTKVL
jgi:hypothetical protein